MQNDLKDVREKVDKMFYALMGNDLTNDGGLIKRIIELEEENLKLRKEMQDMRLDATKAGLYIKIIWGMAGALGASILALALKTMFN